MTEQQYGPVNRYGRNFAERSLLSDKNDNFFDKPMDEQVKEIAWTEGCPVKDKVIKKRGAEVARNRYGEVVFTSQIILAEAEEHNPELYQKLTERLTREEGEPVGEHEPNSVPAAHLTEIAATETPWGYALPRILVKQFGDGKERTQERMLKGFRLLEESVKQAKSPLELIAILANKCSENVSEDSILHEAFSKGYLGEENTFKLFKQLLQKLKVHAPRLYKHYIELSSEQKSEKGIAELKLAL
jgi:hypothetical protein